MKDGGLCSCINYYGLNQIKVKTCYPFRSPPLPSNYLKGATIFTKVDLGNTYHLVWIREGDEWRTAFNTPAGHYEYIVMSFRLTNTSAMF